MPTPEHPAFGPSWACIVVACASSFGTFDTGTTAQAKDTTTRTRASLEHAHEQSRSPVAQSATHLDGDDHDAPREVSFEDVFAVGSGCPAGTAVPIFTSSRDNVVVLFSEFAADLNALNPVAVSSCKPTFKIRAPRDWSYAVTRYAYNLRARVPADAQATFFAQYGYSGVGAPQASAMYTVDDDEELFATVVSSPRFSDCVTDRSILVALTLTIESNGRDGFVAMDHASGDIGRAVDTMPLNVAPVRLELEWRRCPARPPQLLY